MRELMLLGMAAIGFATMACAETIRLGEPAQAPIKAAQPNRGAIVIREQSNVCVSVEVDQRVWPNPLLPDSSRNFSNILSSALRQAYEQRGGVPRIPGPRRDPRFVAYLGGANPLCQQPEDVVIAVRYGPRSDGKPFTAIYRITQDALVKSGTWSRNLEEEWRSGSLPRTRQIEPLQVAISDDIRSRAALLLDEIDGVK